MTTETMRVLVLEDFGRMTVQERPVPQPGAGEALVRVAKTGICGSDLHGYTGENGRRTPGQVMGHETVGHVVAYGPERPTSAPGVDSAVTLNPTISCGLCRVCQRGLAHLCAQRRVIGVNAEISSAFGQYVAVPARNLVVLPEGMPLEHGALIEPLSVGFHAAGRGRGEPGDIVAVVGAGPIGQAAALGALRLGAAIVVVSEPSPMRRSLVECLGARAVDPGESELSEVMMELTDGLGADVSIDAVGTSGTVRSALCATRRGGSCVLVGMNSPTLDLDAYGVSTDERNLAGAFCYSESEFRQTVEWAATAGSELDALISRTVSLDEAPNAFRSLAGGDEGASKVLVNLG